MCLVIAYYVYIYIMYIYYVYYVYIHNWGNVYIPHILLLYILYIHVEIWTVLAVFPNVILSHIHISPRSVTTLYIHLHTVNSINCTANCNTVPHLFFPMLHHSVSCIYTYTLWIVLTVPSNIKLSHNFIVPMLHYWLSCIYTYKLY